MKMFLRYIQCFENHNIVSSLYMLLARLTYNLTYVRLFSADSVKQRTRTCRRSLKQEIRQSNVKQGTQQNYTLKQGIRQVRLSAALAASAPPALVQRLQSYSIVRNDAPYLNLYAQQYKRYGQQSSGMGNSPPDMEENYMQLLPRYQCKHIYMLEIDILWL